MSLWIVIGVLVMICVMSWWSVVREMHTLYIWKTDPYFPRNGTSNMDTLRWYLARKNKSCDKTAAKRRPRRAF